MVELKLKNTYHQSKHIIYFIIIIILTKQLHLLGRNWVLKVAPLYLDLTRLYVSKNFILS